MTNEEGGFVFNEEDRLRQKMSDQTARASEAQTRASEQETRASETQTRASEKETRASEKETRAAEILTGELQAKTRRWENGQTAMLVIILIISAVSIVISGFALNRQSNSVQAQAACNQEVKVALIAQQSIDARINMVNAQDAQNISALVFGVIPYLGRQDAQAEIRALFDRYHTDTLATGQQRTALTQDQKDHPIPDIHCD